MRRDVERSAPQRDIYIYIYIYIEFKSFDRDSEFIAELVSKKTLTFGSDTAITNPVHGLVLETPPIELNLKKAYESGHMSVKSKLSRRSKTLQIDILTAINGTADLQLLKLRHVANLIRAMQDWFGVGIGISAGGESERVVVIDAGGTPLLMLVTAIECLSKAFFAKFKVEPPSTSFSELSEALKACVRNSSSSRRRTTFVSRLVDANIFDPALNSLVLKEDRRPTGPIFHPGFPYQISLMGIVPNVGGQSNVRVVVRDSKTTNEIMVSASDTQTHFSAKHIVKLIKRAAVTPLDRFIKGIDLDARFALKRAGDWGQVEHCKRYGGMIFTKDKMMALYAHSRGVDCILYSFDEHRFADISTPDIFRYCFHFVSQSRR